MMLNLIRLKKQKLKKGNYIELNKKEVLNILSKFNVNYAKSNKIQTTMIKKDRR